MMIIHGDDLKQELEKILSTINGVGQVRVLITYSQTSQSMPMYNEDSKVSVVEEKDTSGGTRKTETNEEKKEVIYQEESGKKTPIMQSVVMPKVEGAIITATGAKDAVIKANIIQAVEAATGLATHKIQVFEMTEI